MQMRSFDIVPHVQTIANLTGIYLRYFSFDLNINAVQELHVFFPLSKALFEDILLVYIAYRDVRS